MLFSSLTFLLFFLPVVVAVHCLLPKKGQNAFLFLASLVFYAWGEMRFVPFILGLTVAHYVLGLLL